MDEKDVMIDVFKGVDEDNNEHDDEEVIDFLRKKRFKPQRERSGVRRKHTITQKVELQSVSFVTRQDIVFFLKLPRKKRGKRVPKNTSSSKDIFQRKNSKCCAASVVYTIDDHVEIPMVINVGVMESTFMRRWTAELWRM